MNIECPNVRGGQDFFTYHIQRVCVEQEVNMFRSEPVGEGRIFDPYSRPRLISKVLGNIPQRRPSSVGIGRGRHDRHDPMPPSREGFQQLNAGGFFAN